jgi:succinate dehydrogenase / fumarate reductase cytochrome b subunit
MSFVVVLGELLWAILQVVVRSFVTSKSRREAVSTSAVFLVVFFVVHGLGNTTALISGTAFNKYGQKLHSLGPLLYAVEAYLALAFLWHAVTGILLTRSDKKLRLSTSEFSWTQARLCLSGGLFAVFLVVHVAQFRFGAWYETMIDGVAVRDLWRLQQELFASRSLVAFYCASVAVIGAHLAWGWRKTVRKPNGLGGYLRKESVATAEAIGNALTFFLVAAYVSVPIYTYVTLPA